MATADEYAAWIVQNADKKGTPDFDIVAKAYQTARAGAPAKQATSADIPLAPGAAERMAAEDARRVPEVPDSLLGKIAAPFEAAAAIGTGMIGGLVGAAAAGPLGIPFSNAKDAKGMEEEGGRLAESMTYQPRTQTGRQMVETIGKVAVDSGIAGIPIPELATLGRASAPARGIAKNAAMAGAEVVGDAAAGVASKVGSAITPTVSPKVAALAQRAQSLGIELRPDMLVDNKYLKILGDTLEKIPLSGAKTEGRQVAFNRALIDLIGGDKLAARLTPDVYDSALRKAGSKIGDIANRTPIAIDAEFSAALESRLQNSRFETDSVGRVLTNYISEITSKAEDGIIPGTTFRKLDTQIGKQIRRTGDGDLKHALSELQDDMQDALQRSASQGDLEKLLAARKQYAIAKTIEPLVAKSPSGDISPAGLMGRVTSDGAGKGRMARGHGGELGEIARIGQQFLKEPASSGTAERGAVYGGLAGGAWASPATTASIYAGANLYNRLGPRVANRMIGRSVVEDAPEAAQSPLATRVATARQAQAERAALAAADAQAKSNLAARVAAARQKKADGIANSGSVADAVRAFIQPLSLDE